MAVVFHHHRALAAPRRRHAWSQDPRPSHNIRQSTLNGWMTGCEALHGASDVMVRHNFTKRSREAFTISDARRRKASLPRWVGSLWFHWHCRARLSWCPLAGTCWSWKNERRSASSSPQSVASNSAIPTHPVKLVSEFFKPILDLLFSRLHDPLNTQCENVNMEDTLTRSDSIVTVFPQSDRFKGIPQKRAIEPHTGNVQSLPRKRFLNLPVNPPSLFSEWQDRSKTDWQGGHDSERVANPSHFQSILEEDQAGECTLAYRRTNNFPMVVIKHRAVTGKGIETLRSTSQKNVCNLLDFFPVGNGSISLVYECLAVSLSEIQACPTAPLQEYELAAVATEV